MNRLNLTLLLSTGLLTTAFLTSESRVDSKDANSEKVLNGPIESESIDKLSSNTVLHNTTIKPPLQGNSDASYDQQKRDDPLSG